MTPTRRQDVLALVILTSLITILFIDVLAGVNDLYAGDLLQYAYPNKKVLRDVVLGGEFPYWNRSIGGGQPMAANPAHEVFYPLTWLILLPGFGHAFQLFILIHIYLAGWAMYALLRSLAIRPAASFLGALSFALGGAVLSYATYLPLLATVAWLPLTLLFSRRFLRQRSNRDFAFAAICFGMQLLIGEPTTILQTGVLLGLYASYHGARQSGAGGALRGVAMVALISVAAFLVGAVAMIPMIDHAADSVRSRGLPFKEVVEWSLPTVRLGELFHANLFGHMRINGVRLYWGRLFYDRGYPFLPSIYPGVLITVLAIAGSLARIRGTTLFVATFAFSVLLASGGNTPLWSLLYEGGLVRSLRYPEKFMLMGLVALIIFAARALDLLLEGDPRVQRMAVRVTTLVAIAASLCALIALAPFHPALFETIWSASPSRLLPMVAASRSGWILTAARVVLLLLLFRAIGRARPRTWIVFACTFVLLDLTPLIPELAPRVEPRFLREPPAVLRNLPPNHDQYRLFHHALWHRERKEVRPFYVHHPDLRWVVRNAATPFVPIAHGVQLAMSNDYDYTALLPTADFLTTITLDLPPVRHDWMAVGASMSNAWYRVVYLDPKPAMLRADGDRTLMQPVGILRFERTPRYSFASHLETVRDRLEFVSKLTPGRSPKGTAFVFAPSFTPASGRVLAVHETSNTARIEVETTGRAFLVMSVTPHKYWTITIDGGETEAIVTNIGYQGVVVPGAGRHLVEMRYHNPLITAGAAISLSALLGLWWAARRRKGAGDTAQGALD